MITATQAKIISQYCGFINRVLDEKNGNISNISKHIPDMFRCIEDEIISGKSKTLYSFEICRSEYFCKGMQQKYEKISGFIADMLHYLGFTYSETKINKRNVTRHSTFSAPITYEACFIDATIRW